LAHPQVPHPVQFSYASDGRFATLRSVVDHYDKFLKSGLTEAEKNDLIEYLLSL